MIKKLIFLILIISLTGACSFDTKSGLWTANEDFEKETVTNKKIKVLFQDEKIIEKEFNKNFQIKTPLRKTINYNSQNTNNENIFTIKNDIKKISKFNFSKIKYFDFFEPNLTFDEGSLFFFDKKGTIIKFDNSSNLIWKKNYYDKKDKKLLPILNFASNKNTLLVSDSLSNYYALDIKTGKLRWKENHNSLFISDIKIDDEYFFVIDMNNIINCFSLKNGKLIWTFNTDNVLIKSQKKLSIVIDNRNIYFNNSNGDIYSLNKKNGNLNWLIPTNYKKTQPFLLKYSNLVLDDNNIYFSNNESNFFSIDKNNGFVVWEQKINSDLKPIIVDELIFTISSEGYFYIIEKVSGNIIRVTDVFENFSQRKRKKISPIGFILTDKNAYLSVSNGRILEIDIATGKHLASIKIDKGKISKPFINNGEIFVIKDNSIIKLN